jgi:hypothetical protein
VYEIFHCGVHKILWLSSANVLALIEDGLRPQKHIVGPYACHNYYAQTGQIMLQGFLILGIVV